MRLLFKKVSTKTAVHCSWKRMSQPTYWLLFKRMTQVPSVVTTVRKLKSTALCRNWSQKPKSSDKSGKKRAKGFHQVQIIVDKEWKRIILFTRESKEQSLLMADQFRSVMTHHCRKKPEQPSPLSHKPMDGTLTRRNCNREGQICPSLGLFLLL